MVCVSGETDYIIDKKNTAMIKNGHALMPKVTGLGCTASALCGAFAAVNPDHFAATAAAMAVMGIAGEIAAEKAAGPGELPGEFPRCAVCNMTDEEIEQTVENFIKNWVGATRRVALIGTLIDPGRSNGSPLQNRICIGSIK